MRSIVQRIMRSALWRGFNKWCLFAEIKRHRRWRRVYKRQKDHALAALRGVLRWSKKELILGWHRWQDWSNLYRLAKCKRNMALSDKTGLQRRWKLHQKGNAPLCRTLMEKVASRNYPASGKEAKNRVTVNLGAHQIGRIMSRALAAVTPLYPG